MQKYCLGWLLLCLPLFLFAEKRVPSTIKEVTLYRSGAKITSTAKVALAPGSNEIVFEKLPVGIEAASVQVRIGGGKADLMSAFFRANVIETIKPDFQKIQVLTDSIVLVQDQLARIASEVAVLHTEETLIVENQKRVGSGQPLGLNITDYQQLIAFYRTRVREIHDQLLALDIEKRRHDKRIGTLQERINKLSQQATETAGEIVLQIESGQAQQIDISCIYLVYDAGWAPLYDLRAESVEAPLQLVYKASVRQNSGYDWTGVKLRLSSAQPLLNNSRPILNPQYIDYRVYAARIRESAQGLQTEAVKEMDRAYNLAPTNMMQVPNLDDSVQPVLFDLGAETPQNFEVFDLTALQNIRNGENNQIVRYKEEEIKALYEYHAVPKLDPSVYLLAKIPHYGRYGLLSGTAQIFFKDTYIGQSVIDLQTVSDTLMLSLGRDEDISIKRVKPTDVTYTPKFLGNNKKETFAYDIIVKNNKTVPINIEILDQIPVSRQADIEVELDEKSGATYQADYGKLLWKLKLPAYKNTTLRFSYTIKYPKDKQVAQN
jgi:uncharacterized protein (TIGR02231 family)